MGGGGLLNIRVQGFQNGGGPCVGVPLSFLGFPSGKQWVLNITCDAPLCHTLRTPGCCVMVRWSVQKKRPIVWGGLSERAHLEVVIGIRESQFLCSGARHGGRSGKEDAAGKTRARSVIGVYMCGRASPVATCGSVVCLAYRCAMEGGRHGCTVSLETYVKTNTVNLNF